MSTSNIENSLSMRILCDSVLKTFIFIFIGSFLKQNMIILINYLIYNYKNDYDLNFTTHKAINFYIFAYYY